MIWKKLTHIEYHLFNPTKKNLALMEKFYYSSKYQYDNNNFALFALPFSIWNSFFPNLIEYMENCYLTQLIGKTTLKIIQFTYMKVGKINWKMSEKKLIWISTTIFRFSFILFFHFIENMQQFEHCHIIIQTMIEMNGKSNISVLIHVNCNIL